VRQGGHRQISVYRFPRRALTLCPQLCMGIQPDARFPARIADALPTTLYGNFILAIYRNRPIENKHSTDDDYPPPDPRVCMSIHPIVKSCSDLGYACRTKLVLAMGGLN